MKTGLISFSILLFVKISLAQVPGSEIYLFDLSAKKDKITISHPINITNHKGYDNQPYFHPDKPVVYYSSMGDSSHTDILLYDYKAKVTQSVTKTTENEFSPTLTLDKQYLSCIIQRANGAQDLGKYPLEGGEAIIILDNMTVGYHVWVDNSHLGLFILGTPNTLHFLRLPTKKDTVLAENIGKSLHRVPGQSAISFIHKISEKEWLIKKLSSPGTVISTIGPTLPGREDLAWLPDGRILMSDGTKLFFFNPAKGSNWTEVQASEGAALLKGITRLAVSADGKKLAVVVAE